MAGVGDLSGVALDCPEPAVLAEFYRGITGWPILHADPDWYSVGASRDAALHLSFQRAPDHRPPAWPDPASSMQLHLHFRVDDLVVAQEAVLRLGGVRLDDTTDPTGYRVFADPAGHPFCLVQRPQARRGAGEPGRRSG